MRHVPPTTRAPWFIAALLLVALSALACEEKKPADDAKKQGEAPQETAAPAEPAEPADEPTQPSEPAAVDPATAIAQHEACKSYAQGVVELCLASVKTIGGGACSTEAFKLGSILESNDPQMCEFFASEFAERLAKASGEPFALEGACATLVADLETRCLEPIATQGRLSDACDPIVGGVELGINSRHLPPERCEALQQELDAAVPAAQ